MSEKPILLHPRSVEYMRAREKQMPISPTLLATGIFLGWLNVTALAQQAGTKLWDYFVGPVGQSITAPAVGPDGTLYVTGNGSLYALDANGNLKAQITSNGGVPIIAGDGTVYRAQGPTLYA